MVEREGGWQAQWRTHSLSCGGCVCVHMSHPSPGSGRVQDCVGREQRASVAQEASFLFSHRAGFPKPLLSSLDFSLDFPPPPFGLFLSLQRVENLSLEKHLSLEYEALVVYGVGGRTRYLDSQRRGLRPCGVWGEDGMMVVMQEWDWVFLALKLAGCT